jgi:hypothetical protein
MHFRPVGRKERDLSQEKLLSPKELGALVGLSTAQVRALMNDGRLEFVEITPKTRLLTMTGWERFQRQATKVRDLESERGGAVQGVN